MEAEGQVLNVDGTAGPIRDLALGRYGHALTGDLTARYYEAVRRGMVFSAGTAASGVAPGTAIGTTAAFTLANPSGSGKAAVLLKVSMGYISGTLGAGTIHYVANVNPAAAAVSGTGCTVVNNYLSSSTAGNSCLVFTTATLPAAPTIMRPFCSLAALTAAGVTQSYMVVDEPAGEIVLAPGCAVSLEGTTASGSTPLVVYGAVWMEVAV